MDLPARTKSYKSSVDLATKMQNPAVPHPLIQGRLPTRIHDQMYKIPRETYSTYNKLVTECLDEGQRGDFLKCASDCQCEMCEEEEKIKQLNFLNRRRYEHDLKTEGSEENEHPVAKISTPTANPLGFAMQGKFAPDHPKTPNLFEDKSVEQSSVHSNSFPFENLTKEDREAFIRSCIEQDETSAEEKDSGPIGYRPSSFFLAGGNVRAPMQTPFKGQEEGNTSLFFSQGGLSLENSKRMESLLSDRSTRSGFAVSAAKDISTKPTESTAPSSSATAPTVNSKAPSLRFETKTISGRLRELKELLEENLITESEYQSQRNCIIATI